MNLARLKLPGFALLCVALGIWGLSRLSGRTAELASKQTAERLAWGQLLFETSGRLAQSYQASALAAAAADPSLAQALASSKDRELAPAAAAAAQKAVSAAFEKLPKALRSPGQILVATPRSVSALSEDGGAHGLAPGVYDLESAAQATGAAHALVDGQIYRVAAAPIRGSDGVALGYLGVAAPLDDAFAAERAKDLTMEVTILGGQAVSSSLPAPKRATVAATPDGPVELEKRKTLPLFAGGASLTTDKAFALEGASGARVVLTATSLPLQGLADFQQKAFLFLAGLALVGLALTLVPASPEEEGDHLERPVSRQESSLPARGGDLPLGSGPTPRPFPAPLAIPEPPPAAGSPDDFPFGDPLKVAALAQAPHAREPGFGDEPFGGAPARDLQQEPPPPAVAAPPLPPEPAPSPAFGASFFGQETPAAEPLPPPVALSEPPPAASPFPPLGPLPSPELAGKPFDSFGPAPGIDAANDPIEKTAVSTVPEHLLRATRWPTPTSPLESSFDGGPVPLPAPTPAAPPPSGDDVHFQDVYQQFLVVRAQCSQTADGLTYEKFAAKLRKNKEQLVQKYSCRTVRFQVYVKDGKAALKASPVKD